MKITLKNFQKKVPIPRRRVFKAAKAVFRRLSFEACGLSIVFTGTKRMRAVNKKYLKHDYVTDVLAFDLGENMKEIIICPLIARANARRHQSSTEKEIILYVIHGILHLAGFDDHHSKDTLQMRRMENELLRYV